MNIVYAARAWAKPIFWGALSLVLATLIASGTHAYIDFRHINFFTNPHQFFGYNPYTSPILVQSIDATHTTMTAVVRHRITNETVPYQFEISATFKIERQDPIIKDGVIVGLKPPTPATLDDLVPGTRGVALLSVIPSGTTVIEYLLIGDPFPRP